MPAALTKVRVQKVSGVPHLPYFFGKKLGYLTPHMVDFHLRDGEVHEVHVFGDQTEEDGTVKAHDTTGLMHVYDKQQFEDEAPRELKYMAIGVIAGRCS